MSQKKIESLFISQARDTPQVGFYPDDGEFEIIGISHPEDALTFYVPVIEWLQRYCSEQLQCSEGSQKQLQLKIFFRHCNSISQRLVGRICRTFSLLSGRHHLSILWLYEPGDSDICDMGEDLFDTLQLDVDCAIHESPIPIPNLS